MSLNELLEHTAKPWCNVRLNELVVDNALTVTKLGGASPQVGDALVATDVNGVIGFSAFPISGVSSVSNSDGSLTIAPNTGAVVASLNVNHANYFTATQLMPTITLTTNTNQIAAQNNGAGNSQTINMQAAPATSQVVTVPDMGTAAGQFLLTQGAGQTVAQPVTFSGNNVVFSFSPRIPGSLLFNVAGAQLGYAQGSISLAGFQGSYSAAVTLLNAPGAGLYYKPLAMSFKVTYGGVPFTSTEITQFVNIGTPTGKNPFSISYASINGISGNRIITPTQNIGAADIVYTTNNVVNQQIILSSTLADWTGGTGSTITYSMLYEVDTFP